MLLMCWTFYQLFNQEQQWSCRIPFVGKKELMLLKNLMEDKQLNFNQPFLSVRRHGPTPTSQRSERRRINTSLTSIPRLPSYRSELKSGPIRDPGAIPFLWEQSPGQPKEETKANDRSSDEPPIAPKPPPGRYQQDCGKIAVGCKNQVVDLPHSNGDERRDVDVPSDSRADENVERCKETIDEEERSDSEDSDGAYVDALDTLSRTESSFLNCSMSGLSGGNFSTERQAREFIMDRFLPAAKAMASETPQHAPKKQPFLQKQPQQPKKTIDQSKPSLRYGPSFADRYTYHHDNRKGEEEEEEDSDVEYDQRQNVPAVCGLLPRFCLKSSLCLLNPVPAMSVRTRVPSKKVQHRSSPAGSYSEIDRRMVKTQTAELDQENGKLRNRSGHVASLSTSTASLPFLEDEEVLSAAEETTNARIQGLGSHAKGFKTFQEFLDDQGSPGESSLGDPIIEKTLYIDTVQNFETSDLLSCKPKTEASVKGVPSLREEDEEEIITKRICQTHEIDSSLQDLKQLTAMDVDKNLLLNADTLCDSNVLSSTDKSTVKRVNQGINPSKENTDEVTEQGATESLEKQFSIEVTIGKSYQYHSGLLAPPPLPKSPSDSWLWRTLATVTTKSSSLRSYRDAGTTNPENQLKKAPTSDMKWENIVKASKEMLTTIPET